MVEADALHEGDDVLAGTESVAELHHFDGSVTRLDTGATAALDRIADPDGRPHVVLRLGRGNSWHRTAAARTGRGQYEARTASASAMARTATFVVRCEENGAAWFAALVGTVVVRSHAGGTVVLRAGETVEAAADGALDEVVDVGDALAAEDWVAVNILLDEEEPPPVVGHEADDLPEPEPEPDVDPEPEPVAEADDDDTAVLVDDDGDHPWRVGVAAAAAIGIGIFSVVIGRAGTATPLQEPADDPAIAVPGPPAFSTPAFTAPAAATAPTAETPPRPVEEPESAQPSQPADSATAAGGNAAATTADYDLDGRSCSRGGTSVIVYNGTLHNQATTTRTFTVHVKFTTGRGAIVATASDTVTVGAGERRAVRAATPPLRNARAASVCDVLRVDVA
ncbi:MAG: hypothetical protein KY443_07335 [Actinobacteria bacterium]|nr:hypothetical protein [Actinomycetota bacterium]